MPRPKPPRISAADAGWPSSSTSATRIAVATSERPRNRRSIAGAAPALGAASVAVVIANALMDPYEPSPSFFFRSSHLVRAEAMGRLGLLVHSTIEPA